MDLRLLADEPSVAEREAVDGILGPPESMWDGGGFDPEQAQVAYGGHRLRERRHLLLPALHALQDDVGWISRGGLGYICRRLTIPPAEAYGVASFYSLFDLEERTEPTLHVCDDIACVGRGESADPGSAVAVSSPCLGRCHAPGAALLHEPGAGYSVAGPAGESPVRQEAEGLRLLRRVGHVDPGDLGAYRAAGGFEVLTRALTEGREWVLDGLERSGLRGRGGAAFPIAAKWRGVAAAEGSPKFVIANGDESEPGTFKDRVLMEGDPFAVVESLALAGFATGADDGFIYVRGEYPVAEERLRAAVAAAHEAGLLGEAAWERPFDIEIRRGAGAYVCGEETALFASIEGHRGEPRQKPPFPTTHGVFGRPTAINNIETLVAGLAALEMGPDEFAAVGTDESTGPKLFCVSGDVAAPGVFEVPFGIALSDLIDLAGGPVDGIGAALVGGAAGTFVGPDDLGMSLSFEGASAAGASLGSGAIIVFGRETDFGPVVRRIARFFADESCGQCVPCRIGTVRQAETLERMAAGAPLGSAEDERERLDDLAAVMGDASICGLGQAASWAVQSALRLRLRGVTS